MDDDELTPDLIYRLDGLTTLPGRGALALALRAIYAQAREAGRPVTVLCLDMDRFREINFRYLMTSGYDAVLADIAQRIAKAARPGDFIARDGGDQITLVLADTDQAEGTREAERLREVIARDPVIVDGEPIRVTACVGVATATFAEADSFDLFYRARDAVHAAKDAGRNRVAAG